MATMQYDVWSVKVGSDADFYVVENTYAGTLPLSLPLANTLPGRNGYGYKVSVTSAGDETGVGFTITGMKVGDIGGTLVSETVVGLDTDTAFSTIYFASVESVVINANTTANVTIGYGGDLALPRCRVKGLYYVASGNAGEIAITPNSSYHSLCLATGNPRQCNTVVSSLYMAAEGILTTNSSAKDYAVVTNTAARKRLSVSGNKARRLEK
jgi:hypothetical protein